MASMQDLVSPIPYHPSMATAKSFSICISRLAKGVLFGTRRLIYLRCTLTVVIASVLLRQGLINEDLLSNSISHLWALGFGAVTAESMTYGAKRQAKSRENTIFLNILITNSPQLLISFLFLTYNSLWTCLLLNKEWFDFARMRKPLRVSKPLGKKLSTYRLQLPYKYGIPLMVLSGILHWLVSQSLFIVEIHAYDADGSKNEAANITAIGYSRIAIIMAIILGSIAIVFGILMGFRRYTGLMPVAGSCSAAISAACHQPDADATAAELPLMWGVPEDGSSVPTTGDQTGHCCFTSYPVSRPENGRLYAGKVHEGKRE